MKMSVDLHVNLVSTESHRKSTAKEHASPGQMETQGENLCLLASSFDQALKVCFIHYCDLNS